MRTAFLVVLLTFAVLPAAGEDAQIVARVNGEDLLVSDLERYLKSVHDTAPGAERSAFELDRLVSRMVNDTLLSQEARALGMAEEPPIPDQVRRYREKLAVAAFEHEVVTEKAGASAEEVRQVFESQYSLVSLQVVTVDERAVAEALKAELLAGADMDEVARRRSVDPYAQRGGHVRSVARRDLQPQIAELAATLRPGELGGPVRTDLGWSVIRLEALAPPDPGRFASVERMLDQLVRHRKAKALRSAVAAEARARHAVRIDEEIVAALGVERLGDGRLVPRFPEGKDVVARVGEGHEVTVGEYGKALLARWSGVRSVEAAAAAAPIILDRLIAERLFFAEALARGYGQRPEAERAVRAFEAEALVPRYLQEVVASGVEVSSDEMRAYFDEHRDELHKPPRIHVGQITVEDLEEAERVARLLREGTDLAWLAGRRSIDRFKDQGGDRGWLVPGSGAFDPRLVDAAPGDVLDPVGTPGNYVVLLVKAREEQGLYSFDEVSGNVRSAVFSRKMRGAIDEFMTTLRSRSEIEVDEDILETLRISGTKTEGEEKSGHGH